MSILNNIKKAAQGNKTIIQTTDAMDLQKIFNNLFYLDKNVEEETKFLRAVMTRGYENQERSGLHASAFIGSDNDFCVRAQVLSLLYKQLQGEQIPVGLKRIFEEGNAIHEKWQRLLIRGGYANSGTLDVTQFNKEYMISFTPDIICEIPEFYEGKMVGEIKSVNTFQFQRMSKHPSASKQLQWYMFLTGIHKGFVLNEDKNNQDFKLEVYDFDPREVATFVDRAESIVFYYERVISESKMVARPKDATSSDSKRCKSCVMRDACWNVGMGRQRLK